MSRVLKIILCFNFIIFIFLIKNSYALNNINIYMFCDNIDTTSGEEFTISFIVSSEEQINIGAYRLKINFDNSKLLYKGLYSDTNNDDMKSFISDGNLTLLYITSENGFTIDKSSSKTILELNFKVLSNADIGKTTISAAIDGLCNHDAVEIPAPEIDPIDIIISEHEAENCDLCMLETSGYTITPKFSPDVTKYSVDVPYDKNTIEFNYLTYDQEACVKVNRKTLKSAGSPTDINLTVISSDKKSRKIYTVTVNRLSKDESEPIKLKSSNNDNNDSNNNKSIATTSNKNDILKSNSHSNDLLKSNSYSNDLLESNSYSNDVLETNSYSNDILESNLKDTNDNYIKDISKSDNTSLPNISEPLVVKETGFNPILFSIISIIFIAISTFIIKHKNT